MFYEETLLPPRQYNEIDNITLLQGPHLAEHPEVGGEGEICHRGVESAAPGGVALPHLKIYVSTS